MEAIAMDNRDFIKSELTSLFKEKYNLDFEGNHRENLDSHLLGEKIRLRTLDLLYIFDDVEKKFDISIPQEAVVLGRFSTFNNILEIIYEEMN